MQDTMKRNDDLRCAIVEDLLPLYCEKLTSEETTEAIDCHLETCEACKEKYRSMAQEVLPLSMEEPEQPPKVLNPFKKTKKALRLQKIGIFLLGLVLCAGIFYAAFLGVVKYDSQDITIDYTTNIGPDEDGNKEYYVKFVIKAPEGKVLSVRTDRSAEPPYDSHHTLYHVLRMPFDDLGEAPNKMEMGYSSNDGWKDGMVITFQCSDRVMKYDLRELVKEKE